MLNVESIFNIPYSIFVPKQAFAAESERPKKTGVTAHRGILKTIFEGASSLLDLLPNYTFYVIIRRN
jgi:hypothetical protein